MTHEPAATCRVQTATHAVHPSYRNPATCARRPPPPTLWGLLALWCLGGPCGAHRAALRMWRVAALQVLCFTLGITLLVMADNDLDVAHIPPQWYVYSEAYTSGALAIVFIVFSQLMYLFDGLLLYLRRLRPARAMYHAPTIPDDPTASLPPPPDDFEHEESYTGLTSAHNELALIWLLLGSPFAAHRWWLGHYCQASFQCLLNVIGVTFALVGAFGNLGSAFNLCVTFGSLLLAIGLLIHLRDLLQLLRGRLGPGSAPPWFWLIFSCCVFLAPTGIHRYLLGRRHSATVFPLLVLCTALLAADAAGGIFWGAISNQAIRTCFSVTEALLATAAGLALVGGAYRDARLLLRGRLKPQPESPFYWRTVYAWLLGGLLFSAHRLVAGKVSWRMTPIVNLYALGFLLVGNAWFGSSVGDPSEDPSTFSGTTVGFVSAIGVAFLVSSFGLWLRVTAAARDAPVANVHGRNGCGTSASRR